MGASDVALISCSSLPAGATPDHSAAFAAWLWWWQGPQRRWAQRTYTSLPCWLSPEDPPRPDVPTAIAGRTGLA